MFVKIAAAKSPSISNTGAGGLLAILAALGSMPASAGPVVFTASGSAAPSSIQSTVDFFRSTFGPNNASAPGPLADGRREINWDGGGIDVNTPGGTPFDVFLNGRGGQFTTPGTGFVQAPPSGGLDDGLAGFFANPIYGTEFGTFSSPRLFTPVGSNITDVLFFIPGTAGGTPATVSGFGAVFTDVDLNDSTKIEFFDQFGALLADEFVPAGTVADQSLSFLGVIFNAGEQISRVRITSGTHALASAANDSPGTGVDLVVMDDFLYSEPQALQAIPEPATFALLGAGLLGLGLRRRVKA